MLTLRSSLRLKEALALALMGGYLYYLCLYSWPARTRRFSNQLDKLSIQLHEWSVKENELSFQLNEAIDVSKPALARIWDLTSIAVVTDEEGRIFVEAIDTLHTLIGNMTVGLDTLTETNTVFMKILRDFNSLLPNHGSYESEGGSQPDPPAHFEQEYETFGQQTNSGSIYGKTVEDLVGQKRLAGDQGGSLVDRNRSATFNDARPFDFDPYPNFSVKDTSYVPCDHPAGGELGDVAVFKGHLQGFPSPGFGSYSTLGIEPSLCFERETRLGQYGLLNVSDKYGKMLKWDTVDWGLLQQECTERNKARFDSQPGPNQYTTTAYGVINTEAIGSGEKDVGQSVIKDGDVESRKLHHGEIPSAKEGFNRTPTYTPRTAILLRSFTGKKYTENDKQQIRALVSELALHTGGEYQVFLLVHVKEAVFDFSDHRAYENQLKVSVPSEFRNMTILWDDHSVQSMYPKIERNEAATVHNAQWLSVQKFVQEHREFEFVWNWEMDSRFTGHLYDILSKLVLFAKQQPRKGLWERNERFYIPLFHKDYDTDFRTAVEKASGRETIWGPPNLPFINPIGPAPPVPSPEEDKYSWGIGEEADLITLSPIFNPVGSNWILSNQVWFYNDSTHRSESLPRRTTIVTQSRLSRRLIDIMHVENLRGNHVGSEMACGTVALLHGLKAVYAPMPVFFDRPWKPENLAKWFDGGPKGVSGGEGSAMGWGQEGRFLGSTWYYRADPPQRLYNNWMGFEDTGIGGEDWEKSHGRPCLPAMFLHPVKDVQPTEPGHSSRSSLPYT